MQRDMKVGMAVGVALIGIVGALFFRREPAPKDKESPPPLQNTEDLDRRIGEKGKVPYMDGVEEFPDHAAPVPTPQVSGSKPASKTGKDDAPRFLTKEEEDRNREMLSRKSAPAPDPIQPLAPGKDETVSSDNIPAHNRDWEPAGPGRRKPAETPRSNPAGTASGSGRTHVIQAGETLSGLAARYLGSSARYREIYEANRSVLRSPDDLRDGVTIVIPDAGKPRDSQSVAGNSSGEIKTPPSGPSRNTGLKARPAARAVESDAGDSPATRNDGATERLHFVPVPRGPFSAGRASAGTGSSRSDAPPSRKPGTPRVDRIEEDQ